MARIPTQSVFVNGLRTLADTGAAVGDLSAKTVAALRGVATELNKHDLQVAELAQLVAVLRQVNGIGEIDSGVTASATIQTEVSASGDLQQDVGASAQVSI